MLLVTLLLSILSGIGMMVTFRVFSSRKAQTWFFIACFAVYYPAMNYFFIKYFEVSRITGSLYADCVLLAIVIISRLLRKKQS